MSDEEKKIIIDEDWKTKVQKEKEELQKKLEQEKAQKQDTTAGGVNEGDEALTPSFETIVGILTTDAMLALGVIAPQGSQQVIIDLEQAQFFIDLLMILRDKTKGNLSPQEEGILNNSIAQLQEIFLVRNQQYHEAQLRQAGIKPNPQQP
ncbi:MAG TPA: DUF1844 domain-containing protein [Candidatus Hydrogenedens sp.]|nr:DUF1844 domain-containing protein [Candidatus Hydrogenedens sp.]HOK09224.1 DUF1844 domain-containing protein [Candidatus Hydrogenedens sp.]HOL19751.1 DUF1844 domain-containing protein [Candidatus Hydrogenedens sp.]HPP59023.1 DUF1844 domain-containing protein [Candidatus Hydrogenedens sp.]